MDFIVLQPFRSIKISSDTLYKYTCTVQWGKGLKKFWIGCPPPIMNYVLKYNANTVSHSLFIPLKMSQFIPYSIQVFIYYFEMLPNFRKGIQISDIKG